MCRYSNKKRTTLACVCKYLKHGYGLIWLSLFHTNRMMQKHSIFIRWLLSFARVVMHWDAMQTSRREFQITKCLYERFYGTGTLIQRVLHYFAVFFFIRSWIFFLFSLSILCRFSISVNATICKDREDISALVSAFVCRSVMLIFTFICSNWIGWRSDMR